MKVFEDLFQLDQSISQGDSLKKAESITKKHPKHLLMDTLCPWVGNKFAYNQFMKHREHNGVHVIVEICNLPDIKEKYGHTIEEEAVQSYFKLAHKLSNPLKGNNFRTAMDENRIYFPDTKSAEEFIYKLTGSLSENKVKDFTLSICIGAGFTKEDAQKNVESARIQAEKHPMKTGDGGHTLVSTLKMPPPPHWSPATKIVAVEKEPILKVKL